MYRNLTHYWRVNLAVLLGATVATAVLAGALLVGDSVSGSLRDLTLDRLGKIDSALITERFLNEGLVDGLTSDPAFAESFAAAAPALILRGSAVHGSSGTRASKIAIQGVDERFFSMWERPEAPSFERSTGQLFPSVAINESLRRELNAAVGDTLLLSFGRFSQVPRDTLMGDTDRAAVVGSQRLSLTHVVPDRGWGRFGLTSNQENPKNAYVSLSQLQRALDQPQAINALFLSHRPGVEGDADGLLARVVSLEGLGLTIERGDGFLAVGSGEFVLRPNVDEAINSTAGRIGAPLLSVQSYLANEMWVGERLLPYSLVAALDPIDPAPWSSLTLAGGGAATPVSPGGVLLGQWAADDLQAAIGDTLEMRYYVVDAREELRIESMTLEVEGIVAMQGLADDRKLTPDYPGIRDAADISSWNPPFPVDLKLIREHDEAYWDEYGPTPKVFVARQTGRELWSTRFGSTTLIRIGLVPGLDLQATEREFREQLSVELPPAAFGLRFRAIKAEGLLASAGATDFAMLFVSFSFFLITAAAILVGLLFSLNVEQRAAEIGLRLAVGFSLKSVRRGLLREGGVLAALGGLLGLAVGVGYAAAMIAGLTTLWRPAVGSSELTLHVQPSSLVIGWFVAVLVVLFSIFMTVRRLNRVAPQALLAGSVRRPGNGRHGRRATALAGGTALVAVGMVLFAGLSGRVDDPGLVFGSGTLFLISGLAFFSSWCRSSKRRGPGLLLSAGFAGMAARNSSWNPGRSILSVALVAVACFAIVAVAANRHEYGDELLLKESGSGGFSLVAESDVPLYQDLNDSDARFDLGFPDAAVADVDVLPFRFLPGDDTSCLNLYLPEQPRILGVPPEMIERGGFNFGKTVGLPEGEENPWTLLESSLEPGVIPAFGDANSMQWVLHLGLGEDLSIEDEYGETIRLRLVGVLTDSLFQSEVLISEEAFLRHFPGRTGYSYFLLDTPPDGARAISEVFESTLDDFGFDSTSSRDKLAAYDVVKQTYMSTFEALGGLGLLLGTLGLGIVLVRSVIERRGELATLRAFGFRRASLAWLVLAENSFLLVIGMLIGTLSAVAAVSPRISTLHVDWVSLGSTLAAILLVGTLASSLAVVGALRTPLLPALKAE